MTPATKKLLWAYRWAERGRPGLRGELVGLALMGSPQAELIIILALLKRPPQI